jgi:hypothetical protein
MQKAASSRQSKKRNLLTEIPRTSQFCIVGFIMSYFYASLPVYMRDLEVQALQVFPCSALNSKFSSIEETGYVTMKRRNMK